MSVAGLAHPIWRALTTRHKAIALSHGNAVRYPRDISPLAALKEPTPQAFDELRTLVETGDSVALFTVGPLEVPGSWKVLRARYIDQMICEQPEVFNGPKPMALGEDDVADMLALTAATEPGPFAARTIQMGRYFGVRSSDGRLASMAGTRLSADTFTEISAVCTHPDFRGQGHSRALLIYLAAMIQAEGKLAMLHVKTENGAKVLYEKLGFRVSRPIHLTVLTPQS